MVSVISQALVGGAVGVRATSGLRGDDSSSPRRWLPWAAAAAASLPDLGVVWGDESSLSDAFKAPTLLAWSGLYALVIGLVQLPWARGHRIRVASCSVVASTSHALLDVLDPQRLGTTGAPESGSTSLWDGLPFAVVAWLLVWLTVRRVRRKRLDDAATDRSPAPPVERPSAEPEEDLAVLEITDCIDLHGFAPRDILDVVDAYLEAAQEQGLTEVRLIHGRGTGYQRSQVRKLLQSHPLVLRFADAPAHRGGWGATIAWLTPTQAQQETPTQAQQETPTQAQRKTRQP